MGRRGDRRPKEVMNPGCPSDKRNLRNRLWQAGRDNDTDHNGTSSQLPKGLPVFRYFDLRLLWLPYDPQDEPL